MAIRIGKFLQKTIFDVTPQDPYHVGIRVPFFSEAQCYGALYASDGNPSAIAPFNEILSAPSKADLSNIEHDLYNLSAADASLMQDILDQLGRIKSGVAIRSRELRGSGEQTSSGESATVPVTVDSGDEEEEEAEEPQLLRCRTPQPSLTPP